MDTQIRMAAVLVSFVHIMWRAAAGGCHVELALGLHLEVSGELVIIN